MNPPLPQEIGIRDIIEIRLALDSIKHQSEKIRNSKEKLDELIEQFVTGLQPSKLN